MPLLPQTWPFCTPTAYTCSHTPPQNVKKYLIDAEDFICNVIITMYHVLRKRIWCPSCTGTLMYTQTHRRVYIYIYKLFPIVAWKKQRDAANAKLDVCLLLPLLEAPTYAIKEDHNWVPTVYIDIDYFRNNLLTSTMRFRHFANSHLRCAFQIHQLKEKEKKTEKRIGCLLHIKISLVHETTIYHWTNLQLIVSFTQKERKKVTLWECSNVKP